MDVVAQAEGSVGKKLLNALLIELKMQSPRFNTMSEEAQGEVIDRLRGQVAEAVHEAVAGIAADSSAKVRVTVDSVAFKEKGVRIVLSCAATDSVFPVAGEVGQSALLVLCDPVVHTADMATVKPTPRQGDLIGGVGDARGPGDDDDAGDEDEDDE